MSIELAWEIYLREHNRLVKWLRQWMFLGDAQYCAALAIRELLTYSRNAIQTPYGPYQQLYYAAAMAARRRGSLVGFYISKTWMVSVPVPPGEELDEWLCLYLNTAWASRLCDLTAQQHMDVQQLILYYFDRDLSAIEPQIIYGAEVGELRTLARLVASLDHKDKALPRLKEEMALLSAHEGRRTLYWKEYQSKRVRPVRSARTEQDHYPRHPR